MDPNEKLVDVLCDQLRTMDEKEATDCAREWSQRLLDAARADGMGGCQLCCN